MAAASASHLCASKCWLAFACIALAVNATEMPLAVSAAAPPSAADLAHCPNSCGNLNISYPFGIGSGCFRPGFEVICSRTTTQQPPKLFLANTTTQIFGTTSVSIVFNIPTTTRVIGEPAGIIYNVSWEAPGRNIYIFPQYTNHMVVIGCGIEACMFDATEGGNMLGCCASMCGDIMALEKGAEGRQCTGLGCCYIEFQRSVRAFRLAIIQKDKQLLNATVVKAFLEQSTLPKYRFSTSDLISDKLNASTVDDVCRADMSLVITDQPSCRTAKMHEGYACAASNCLDYDEYAGYSCACSNEYDYGNPYITGGCTQEYNPGHDNLNCSRSCGNTSISFPFGLEPGCSANKKFLLNCTANKILVGKFPLQYQMENISVQEGLLYVRKPSDFQVGSMTVIDTSSVVGSDEFVQNLENFDFSEQSGIWKWAISNTTCDMAKNQTRYACVSTKSDCVSVTHGHVYIGYRCKCSLGYEGNPYVRNGCNDINECLIPYICNGTCHNRDGGYDCRACPHGTSFHLVEKQCIATNHHSIGFVVATGLGCGFGVLALGLCTITLVNQWKRHVQKKIRRRYFGRNKGLLLEQLISSEERSMQSTKVFSLEELEIATNNFDSTRIVGSGGHGMVYKGILSDQRVVAIKKSKIMEQSEIDQFINEVAILSHIIHRNVVKLFGCCLESEVPLLVYEFISNGTLYDLLHSDLSTKCLLTWDDRTRIALEAANALAYLHSAASIPIFHRDVKSANILLNDSFTAKVSDFGASRSISIGETHVVTIVQGTFGYLDPEYYHTGQLNEKSDVYSFGVILVELLTRKKPIFLNSIGQKQNLSHLFLQRKLDNTTAHILDPQVIEEANQREIDEMALLAETCLKLRGDERPTMRQVQLRLQILRGKLAKKNHEVHVDNAIEQSSFLMSNTNAHTYAEHEAVSNLVNRETTRSYTMEQELVSWSDLPR